MKDVHIKNKKPPIIGVETTQSKRWKERADFRVGDVMLWIVVEMLVGWFLFAFCWVFLFCFGFVISR